MNEIGNSKVGGTVYSSVDREGSTSEGAMNARGGMLLRRNVMGDSSDSRPFQNLQQRNIDATYNITQDKKLPQLKCQLKKKNVKYYGDTEIAQARDFKSLKKCSYLKIIRIAIEAENWEAIEDIMSKIIHIDMTDNKSSKVNRKIVESIKSIGTVNDVFMFAVKHDQLSLVKLLIKTNFDVKFGGSSGHRFAPLCYAVSFNNIPIVDLLLKNGADVTIGENGYWNRNPLLLAVSEGNAECAQLLLESGAKADSVNDRRPPLYCAAQSGSVECAKLLLSYGANLKSSNERMGLMWVAARNNNIEMVKFLLINDVDPNTEDKNFCTSPLTEAVKNNNVNIVRLLLANNKTISGDECVTAVNYNAIVCLNLLLNNGSDVNEGTRSPSLLACAVYKGCINMVKYLKFKGAQFSSADDSEYENKYNDLLNGKQTPLMLRGSSFWTFNDFLDRETLEDTRENTIKSLEAPDLIKKRFLLGYWNDDEHMELNILENSDIDNGDSDVGDVRDA